jgi:hypothetical protein
LWHAGIVTKYLGDYSAENIRLIQRMNKSTLSDPNLIQPGEPTNDQQATPSLERFSLSFFFFFDGGLRLYVCFVFASM